jgi:hypothetical protein
VLKYEIERTLLVHKLASDLIISIEFIYKKYKMLYIGNMNIMGKALHKTLYISIEIRQQLKVNPHASAVTLIK